EDLSNFMDVRALRADTSKDGLTTYIPLPLIKRNFELIEESKINESSTLYKKIEKPLKDFHTKKMKLEVLEQELKKLNPHHKSSDEHKWYNEWVEENIEDYKSGKEYVLDLKSSGSILNSLGDEMDESKET